MPQSLKELISQKIDEVILWRKKRGRFLISVDPFSLEIIAVPLPPKFKEPSIKKLTENVPKQSF